MDLDAAASELYGLDPDGFVARRTELVAEARTAKDRELVKALGALRRPTRTAWLANLLSRQHPDPLDELLDLGPALAEAQRRMDGAELRALSARRRGTIKSLTRLAVAAGRERGYEATDPVRQELGRTLQAALADPQVGEALHRGTLTQAVNYGGFGPEDLLSALAASAPAARPEPTPPVDEPSTAGGEPDPDPAEAERAAQREQLRAAADGARRQAEDAGVEAQEATGRADALAEEVEELRARLRETESAEREALDAARAARRRHQELRRVAQQAEEDATRA